MTVSARPRVAVFVGTRADLGPLAPVLEALATADDLDLRVLTGVMYAADDLAHALPSSVSPERWRAMVVPLAEPMTEVTARAQVAQGALLWQAVGAALPRLGVDVLVVLGDRWELLAVVPAAVLLGVPVVHLHGGEVTEGALDERVRHAVTKLGDQHCVASQDAAQRLRQLGEPPDRIHVTGAPGLDRLAKVEPVDDEALARLVGIDRVERPVALLTYHPPTTQPDAPLGRWATEAAEAALAACGTVIATHPGMDEGREVVLAALTGLASAEPRLRLVPGLGRDYPAVLAAVDVVVGNSSSGVIEAATVHVPAVDVGERQRGRLRGDNVVHSDEGRVSVEAALHTALAPAWRARTAATVNPYGGGGASERIVAIVRGAVGGSRTKPFVDLPAVAPPPSEERAHDREHHAAHHAAHEAAREADPKEAM